MQRKTNIFYLTGQDSNFLTFSNYTECMTGNFLSTDYKMFPTKFICLNLDLSNITLDYVKDNAILYSVNGNTTSDYIDTYPSKLNETITQSDIDNININDLKHELINKLIYKYENKLAFLRDCIINEDKKTEDYLYPLAYLLEVLKEPLDIYITLKENQYYDAYENATYRVPLNNLIIQDNIIPYIGDITEQSYDGTFADMMCIINMNKYDKFTIQSETESSSQIDISNLEFEYSSNILYGWTNEELQKYNEISSDNNNATLHQIQITPEFDGYINSNGYYTTHTNLSKIKKESSNINTTLKFNIIIPLFSLVNIRTSNDLQITNNDDIDLINNAYNYNVPLGIWISENPVELKYDNSTNQFPVWSLVISSQFKPFPYSKLNENNNLNNVNDKIEQLTYAEILCDQKVLLDKYIELNEAVQSFTNEFRNELNVIKDKLDSIEYVTINDNETINTTYDTNGDIAKNQLVVLMNTLNKNYESLNNEIQKVLNDLKWHSYETN